MIRTLTAKDRPPQIGDVLVSLGENTYEITQLCPLGTGSIYSRGRHRPRYPKPTWQYVSRADGGEITIEEEEKPRKLTRQEVAAENKKIKQHNALVFDSMPDLPGIGLKRVPFSREHSRLENPEEDKYYLGLYSGEWIVSRLHKQNWGYKLYAGWGLVQIDSLDALYVTDLPPAPVKDKEYLSYKEEDEEEEEEDA